MLLGMMLCLLERYQDSFARSHTHFPITHAFPLALASDLPIQRDGLPRKRVAASRCTLG